MSEASEKNAYSVFLAAMSINTEAFKKYAYCILLAAGANEGKAEVLATVLDLGKILYQNSPPEVKKKLAELCKLIFDLGNEERN